MTYDSPKEIALFLGQRGLSLKKRFGQNFLVSPGARRKIIALLDVRDGQSVWEIGAGIGSMTHLLVESAATVVAFEIDHGLVRVLEESLGDRPSLFIVPGDYLRTWESIAAARGLPDVVFGNLPYSAAAPIIASLVGWEQPVCKAVLTVQREVAQRMAAAPGTKEYSGFSLMCQSVFDVHRAGDLAAASFYPAPEVTSSLVTLTPNDRVRNYDKALYGEVVRNLFASRRKTVKNNLTSGSLRRRYPPAAIEGALQQAGIAPAARGEELSVDRVIDLVSALQNRGEE